MKILILLMVVTFESSVLIFQMLLKHNAPSWLLAAFSCLSCGIFGGELTQLIIYLIEGDL